MRLLLQEPVSQTHDLSSSKLSVDVIHWAAMESSKFGYVRNSWSIEMLNIKFRSTVVGGLNLKLVAENYVVLRSPWKKRQRIHRHQKRPQPLQRRSCWCLRSIYAWACENLAILTPSLTQKYFNSTKFRLIVITMSRKCSIAWNHLSLISFFQKVCSKNVFNFFLKMMKLSKYAIWSIEICEILKISAK